MKIINFHLLINKSLELSQIIFPNRFSVKLLISSSSVPPRIIWKIGNYTKSQIQTSFPSLDRPTSNLSPSSNFVASMFTN